MKVHFIEIGGSVIHQLDLALLSKGYQVTVSDDEIFEPARSDLEKAGLLVDNGYCLPRFCPCSIEINGIHQGSPVAGSQKRKLIAVLN